MDEHSLTRQKNFLCVAMDEHLRIYTDASNDKEPREEAAGHVRAYCHREGMVALKTLISGDLRKYMLHDTSSVRENAMQLLAESLEAVLQTSEMTGLLRLTTEAAGGVKRHDAEMLFAFFVGRFEDYVSVGGAMQCVLHLVKYKDSELVTPEQCAELLTAMSKMNVPAMVQEWRKTNLELYQTIFANSSYVNHVRTLDGKANEFIGAFKDSVWLEKDPRCLIRGLSAANTILRTFGNSQTDIDDTLLEALFETTSCYFPITFRPPKDDPHQITPESLIDLLQQIFSSTPRLGKHVFPFLIEKIESELDAAKIQSFEAWAICVEAYGLDENKNGAAGGFVDSRLSDALLDEILRSTEEEVVAAALTFVKRMVSCCMVATTKASALSNSNAPTSAVSSSWSSFAHSMLSKSTIEISGSPDSLIGRAAARLLQAFAAASSSSFVITMSKAVPMLKELHDKSEQPSQRDATREALALLTDIIDEEVSYYDAEQSLTLVFKDIKTLFWTTYQETPVDSRKENIQRRSLCLMALRNMIVRPPISFIEKGDLESISVSLASTILKEQNEAVRSAALKFLLDVASKGSKSKNGGIYKMFYASTVLPYLETELKKILCKTEENTAARPLGAVLQALANFAVLPDYCTWAISSIYTFASAHAGNAYYGAALYRAFAKAIECLKGNVNFMSWCFSARVGEEGKAFAYALFDDFIKQSQDGTLAGAQSCRLCYERIFRVVTQNASLEHHEVFVQHVVQAYLDKNAAFSPLVSEAAGGDALGVLVSVLGSCKRTTLNAMDQHQLEMLMQRLIAYRHIESASRCLAAVFNKVDISNNAFNQWVNQAIAFDAPTAPGVKTMSWIGKSLVMRGHKSGEKFVQKIFEALQHEGGRSVSDMACASLPLILQDSKDVLSDSCDTNKTLFFKQRFFESILSKLKSKLEDVDRTLRANHIKAVLLLAKHVPTSALDSHMATILPLTIEAVSSKDNGLSISALKTFLAVLERNRSDVEEHLDTVVPAILRLTRSSQNKNAEDRLLALTAMLTFLKYPYLLIHPYKARVLKGLEEPIGDRSRAVRRKAVEVRNEWFVVSMDV